MARWSRPIGLLLSLVVVVVLVIVNLTGGPSEPGPRPDLRNGVVFIQDNLWTAGAWQYAVWVGGDGTPYAGRHRPGSDDWQIANLARLPGNPFAAPTADDEHNVYAIATDAAGGVHVAGNMHDDPLRYARASGDLHGWATAPAPQRTTSTTYPAFTALPDGTLLFWRREGFSGEGAILLDSLAPGARSWQALGPVLDGRPSGESPYLHHIAVDPSSGAIHLLFEWRSTGSPDTNNDLGYARSLDGGRTFETSDGTPLASPITHATAETVLDTQPSGSGLLNQGGLTVDAQGRPHGVAVFDRPGGERTLEHFWLDDGWQREELTDVDVDSRPQLAGTPDGRVWLLGTVGGELDAFDVTSDRERLDSREIARVPVGWEPSYDSQALARGGTVQMLIGEGDRPHVVEADLSAD
jgi:hypothetical protein